MPYDRSPSSIFPPPSPRRNPRRLPRAASNRAPPRTQTLHPIVNVFHPLCGVPALARTTSNPQNVHENGVGRWLRELGGRRYAPPCLQRSTSSAPGLVVDLPARCPHGNLPLAAAHPHLPVQAEAIPATIRAAKNMQNELESQNIRAGSLEDLYDGFGSAAGGATYLIFRSSRTSKRARRRLRASSISPSAGPSGSFFECIPRPKYMQNGRRLPNIRAGGLGNVFDDYGEAAPPCACSGSFPRRATPSSPSLNPFGEPPSAGPSGGDFLRTVRARNGAVSSKPAREVLPEFWDGCTSREAIEIRPASGVGASAFALAVEVDGRTRQPNPTFLKSDSPYLMSDPPYPKLDPAVPEARPRRTRSPIPPYLKSDPAVLMPGDPPMR
ncbi:hypothetical protein BD626DRAFT_572545 [Schizophyllum amplum]|uniref:Uncharacterized protein n=1 Tax=Schizophyllum amplum TaxID=97359 RepID=A0A550C464_9AGAR|nr:hypothetical protein BD626DRAFT_572545 [Auriculariopsis ampla]